MNLKKYNSETMPLSMGGNISRSKMPAVSLTKAGIIFFNKGACDLLKLKAGDGISFQCDEDNPGNWYVEKSNEGFTIRANRASTACFNHKQLILEIIAACDLDPGLTYRFPIAGIPTKVGKRTLYGLLTIAGKRK